MKQTLLAFCLLCCLPFYAVADPPMAPSLGAIGLLSCMALGLLSATYTISLVLRKAHQKEKTKFLISLGVSLLFSAVIWPTWYHIYQNNTLYSMYAPKNFLQFLFNSRQPKKAMIIAAYILYCIWAIMQGIRAMYKAMRSAT